MSAVRVLKRQGGGSSVEGRAGCNDDDHGKFYTRLWLWSATMLESCSSDVICQFEATATTSEGLDVIAGEELYRPLWLVARRHAPLSEACNKGMNGNCRQRWMVLATRSNA